MVALLRWRNGFSSLLGGGEEAVDVRLLHAVVGLVALALDGVVFLGAVGLCHEVDAGVLGTDAELGRADGFGPVGEEPHVGVEVGVAGLVAQVGADEFLEVGAFFLLRLGGDAVVGEEALKRSGGHGLLARRWELEGKGKVGGEGILPGYDARHTGELATV